MTVVAFVPALEQVESESSEDYWTYTITSSDKGVEVKSSGTKVQGFVAPETDTGKYDCNTPGYDAGCWAFDSTTGFGPFGSFYAAFDACHGNKIVCHLNPNNLRLSLDGNIKIDDRSMYTDSEGTEHIVNIMWVLPTIYWSVDDSGSLVLSNDPSKGIAYAHTFDGKEEPYKYLGIGVYEASMGKGNDIKLTSTTNSYPEYNHTKSKFREYANSNIVATEDGINKNGHAMLWNLYAWQLYRFCVLTVGGGWNSQGIFGNGDVYGGNYGSDVKATGDLDESGPYAGTIGNSGGKGNDKYHSDSVKAFIEDAWGSLFDFVDGVLICYKDSKVGMYATQAVEPKDSDQGYTWIGDLPTSDGYGSTTVISSTNAGFWGLPTSSASDYNSSNLYDYVWPDSSTAQSFTFYVGGYSIKTEVTAPKYGLSSMVESNNTNTSDLFIGGRLAFAFDADPTTAVDYDHSNLKALLDEFGYSESYMSGLPTGTTVTRNGTYDQLPDVLGENGFRHVGWIIDGKEYSATHRFVKGLAHTAKSVWVGLPAVTYDHSELIALSQDRNSEAGLSHGLEIRGHDSYEQLPPRNGYAHYGWRIEFEGKKYEVGPIDPFVTKNSHTAISLWTAVPMVTFDHSNLTSIVGTIAEGVSDLETGMRIEGHSNYPQLPDTAGYKHIGWEVNGKIVEPTAALESQETHVAKSIWEKIPDSGSFRPIPIIPDDEDDPIEVIVEKESEPWLGKNGKSVILIAVVVAIIAELAVLCISRKR